MLYKLIKQCTHICMFRINSKRNNMEPAEIDNIKEEIEQPHFMDYNSSSAVTNISNPEGSGYLNDLYRTDNSNYNLQRTFVERENAIKIEEAFIKSEYSSDIDPINITMEHSVDNKTEISKASFGISNLNKSSLHSTSTKKRKTSNLLILDGTFYKIDENIGDDKVVAICVKCLPKQVRIRGYGQTTTNFITHLRRAHGTEALEEYHNYQAKKKYGPNSPSVKHKSVSETRKLISQTVFDDDVLKFIIHSMSPLNLVEDPYFLQILTHLQVPNQSLKLISRHTLSRQIDAMFDAKNQNIKSHLTNIEHICISIDVCSNKKINFILVTAHWVNSELKRKSAVLACRKFYDTYENILQEIYTEFGINPNKIISTFIHNDSYFVNVLKILGVESEKCDDFEYDDIQITQNIEKTLDNKSFDCVIHTLSLCVLIDCNKTVFSFPDLASVHIKTINNCNLLWKIIDDASLNEIVQSILGQTLNAPDKTNWNSVYESLQQIFKLKNKCNELLEKLEYTLFDEEEFKYLKEYLSCVKPIAEALDVLQNEKNLYYGVFLPCLLALRRKLQVLMTQNFTYCSPVVESLFNSLNSRFCHFFNFTTKQSEIAAIAAITYPKFKKRWFTCIDSDNQEKLLVLIKKAMLDETSYFRASEKTNVKLPECKSDFFDFGSDILDSSTCTKSGKAELELLRYFEDSGEDLKYLNLYPAIKQLFIKYNTPIPCSAPMQSSFSSVNMINLERYSSLKNENFEKRVFLKANLNFE